MWPRLSPTVSSLLPLLQVTIVFELPSPPLHLIIGSLDLRLAACARGHLSSPADGNRTKRGTAFGSLLPPSAFSSCTFLPRELGGPLPSHSWFDG